LYILIFFFNHVISNEQEGLANYLKNKNVSKNAPWSHRSKHRLCNHVSVTQLHALLKKSDRLMTNQSGNRHREKVGKPCSHGPSEKLKAPLYSKTTSQLPRIGPKQQKLPLVGRSFCGK
jgi:hypothetical protein